jgi:AraC-like DNA-binding protein
LERQHHLVRLLDHAMRHSDRPGAWSMPTFRSEPRAVADVIRDFRDRPGHNHRLEDMSRRTGLNPRYLIRVFKARTGVTPHRYLTAVRVDRAKQLLAAGAGIATVALELGFADQSHLTRVFKEYVQVTPGRFQRLTTAAR